MRHAVRDDAQRFVRVGHRRLRAQNRSQVGAAVRGGAMCQLPQIEARDDGFEPAPLAATGRGAAARRADRRARARPASRSVRRSAARPGSCASLPGPPGSRAGRSRTRASGESRAAKSFSVRMDRFSTSTVNPCAIDAATSSGSRASAPGKITPVSGALIVPPRMAPMLASGQKPAPRSGSTIACTPPVPRIPLSPGGAGSDNAGFC